MESTLDHYLANLGLVIREETYGWKTLKLKNQSPEIQLIGLLYISHAYITLCIQKITFSSSSPCSFFSLQYAMEIRSCTPLY
jgi:hypothetical protein